MPSTSPAPRPPAASPAGLPRALLAWYDRHRRRLPWRALPGETADPYRVWLSEIMLQQTTVKAVGPYFEKFVTRWPDVTALGNASQDDVLRMWAGLGYYSRARNLYACAVAGTREPGGRGGGPAPTRQPLSRRSPSPATPCLLMATSSVWCRGCLPSKKSSRR